MGVHCNSGDVCVSFKETLYCRSTHVTQLRLKGVRGGLPRCAGLLAHGHVIYCLTCAYLHFAWLQGFRVGVHCNSGDVCISFKEPLSCRSTHVTQLRLKGARGGLPRCAGLLAHGHVISCLTCAYLHFAWLQGFREGVHCNSGDVSRSRSLAGQRTSPS